MEKNQKNKSKEDYKTVEVSKTMSYLLRHGAKENNLDMDSRGFIEFSKLIDSLPMKKAKANRESAIRAVEDNNKKRFEIVVENGKELIRAVQGHTIKEVKNEDALDLIDNIYDYPTILHGTYYEAWEFIKKTGLNKMSRNCIHFAIGEKNDSNVISGMRGSCQLYVELDAALCVAKGIQMFISKNKVVLSPGIDGIILPNYFKRVIDKNGTILMSCQYQQVIIPIFNKEKLVEIDLIDLYDGKSLKVIKDEEELNLNAFSIKYLNQKYNEKPTILLLENERELMFKKFIKENYQNISHLSLWNDYLLIDKSYNINNKNVDERSKLLFELNIKETSLFSGAKINKLGLDSIFKKDEEIITIDTSKETSKPLPIKKQILKGVKDSM